MTRLFVEGQEVDLNQEISHQLNFAIDDLINVDSKSTSFSKTIIIPGTANNNKLFGNIFENSNSNFYDPANPNIFYDFNAIRPAQARIEINNLQAMKGVMRLLGITIDNGIVEYEVALFGELGGFVAALGNKRLQDLDFSSYNREWNKDNIINSWEYDVVTISATSAQFYTIVDQVILNGVSFANNITIGDKILIEGTTYNDGVYTIRLVYYDYPTQRLWLWFVENLIPESVGAIDITRIRGMRGAGVVFPLIDYGNVSTGKIDYDFSAFRPALFVKEYMDKIITGAGYTYTSNFFDSHFFNQLIIPNNDDVLLKFNATNYVTASTTDYQFNWFLQNSVDINDPLNNTIYRNEFFPFETIDNITQFTSYNSNGQYISNVTSTRTTKCKLKIRLGITHNQLIKVKTSGFTFDAPKFKLYFNSPNRNREYSLPLVWKYNQASYNQTGVVGREYFVDIEEEFEATINNGDEFSFKLYLKFTCGDGVPNSVKYDIDFNIISAQFIIDQYPSGYIPLNYNETLNINDYIPKNIFQKDFFTSIMKMFNLMVFERRDKTKHLMIEPNAYFYNTKPSSYLDWSYKINRAKPIQIKPMSEINARYYNFKYKDDNDFYNEKYKKKYNETYGNRLYDNRIEFAKDDNNTEVIFSPSVLVGYKQDDNNIDKVVTTIFKKNGEVEQTTPFNIRILYINRINDVYTWNILVNNSSVQSLDNYLYAGHFDNPFNPQLDINYGATNELYYPAPIGGTGNNAFNMFYSPYMAEITDKDSRLITAEIYLTEKDIFNLDFSRYILFDGVLYRLVKIIDWVGGELCKVQLLRVINTTYIPDGDINQGRPIGDNPRERYWSTENFMGRYFNNGDIIPLATTEAEAVAYSKAKEPFCCWYDFDSVNYYQYGLYYSIDAINDERGIAPSGYRIPTQDDYLQLIRFVAGNDTMTDCDPLPLQATGTDYWTSGAGTDDYGFSARGGAFGVIDQTGETINFYPLKNSETLWSQSQFNISTLKYQYYMDIRDNDIADIKNVQIGDSNQYLFNVRFVKEI